MVKYLVSKGAEL